MKYKIYIPTCNKYIKYVEAVLYSFKRYWDDYDNYEIIILGYKPPKFELDSNVKFHSIGSDDSVTKWSNELKQYFENIDDEWFILWNDDCPLSSPINKDILNIFYDIIEENPDSKLGKFCLQADTSTRAYSVLSEYDDFDLIEADQHTDYRLSLPFQIWNRNYLLKYMRPNLSPWQFELQHPRHDGYRILSTRGKFCTDIYQLHRKYGVPKDWYISYGGIDMKDIIEDYDFIKDVITRDGTRIGDKNKF